MNRPPAGRPMTPPGRPVPPPSRPMGPRHGGPDRRPPAPPATTAVPRPGDSGSLAYSQQPPRRDPAPDDRPTTVYPDSALRTQHAADPTPDDPESSPMTAAPRTSTNILAIVALVLSFLGVTAIAGIICGHIARGQIRRRKEYGAQLASAALWIGYAYVAAAILCLIVYLAIAGQGS